MQTGHDYLLVEHKVASEWGGGFWMLANTHRNIRIHCATSDIFHRHPSFLCPLVPHGFFFSEYPWGSLDLGTFFGFLRGVN